MSRPARHNVWSVEKRLTIVLLINCILAFTSSLVLKAIFATKEIKDQNDLIKDALKDGNPWLVALRVLQLYTIIFAIGAQCFTGETLVATTKGLVAIETIEVGDYVLAEDTVTEEKEYKRVLKVHVSQTTKLVHVTISDEDSSETDETINTTDNHPFYVEGKGWVAAIELEEGDILRTADSEVKTVKDVTIEYLDEPELVYNLEIEGYHTYFVSDENVLVHNINNGSCGLNNKDEGSGSGDEGTITRSQHAEQRSGEGRNVGNAINDVNRATPSNVYLQNDGRYVIKGNNGRVHILEPNGEIVTTMNKVTNFDTRVRNGRYIPLTESQKVEFLNLFDQYLNGSWDSYRSN